MPIKEDKVQGLFDAKQYGHFYLPEVVVNLLVGLTQPSPGERVLGIGFYPESLGSSLRSRVETQFVSTEMLPSEQFQTLSSQFFDVILCAPAFGVLSPESNQPSEEVWLQWSIDHLSETGRIAALVPIGLLSNYSQEPFRRFLLEKSGLEAVIELPSGWAQGTAIYCTLRQTLILNARSGCSVSQRLKMCHGQFLKVKSADQIPVYL